MSWNRPLISVSSAILFTCVLLNGIILRYAYVHDIRNDPVLSEDLKFRTPLPFLFYELKKLKLCRKIKTGSFYKKEIMICW